MCLCMWKINESGTHSTFCFVCPSVRSSQEKMLCSCAISRKVLVKQEQILNYSVRSHLFLRSALISCSEAQRFYNYFLVQKIEANRAAHERTSKIYSTWKFDVGIIRLSVSHNEIRLCWLESSIVSVFRPIFPTLFHRILRVWACWWVDVCVMCVFVTVACLYNICIRIILRVCWFGNLIFNEKMFCLRFSSMLSFCVLFPYCSMAFAFVRSFILRLFNV